MGKGRKQKRPCRFCGQVCTVTKTGGLYTHYVENPDITAELKLLICKGSNTEYLSLQYGRSDGTPPATPSEKRTGVRKA